MEGRGVERVESSNIVSFFFIQLYFHMKIAPSLVKGERECIGFE